MRHSLFIFAAVLVVGSAPWFGVETISPFSMSPEQQEVLYALRIPRILGTFAVGAALSVCGALYQALLRNPLASPFSLGVSSGSAVGAAAYVIFGLHLTVLGFSGSVLGGILGALFTTAIVMLVVRRTAQSESVLLSGVILSFFFSSFILFLQYLGDPAQMIRITRWLMGSLERLDYQALTLILPLTAVATFLLFKARTALDLITLGEEFAASRGIDIRKLLWTGILISSLLIGTIVSFCGPIGFVGIMVPHVVRRVVGARHESLLPACVYGGGAFLVACDLLGRVLIPPFEIPVGVITALIGGPCFLWVLLWQKERFSFSS